MNALSASLRRAGWLGLLLALGSVPCLAAATVTQQIDPAEISVDQAANVTISVQNGSFQDVSLPQVDGLQVAGKSTQSGITIINGAMTTSMSVTFALVATRPGDFTIPAFDITTQDGSTLHVHEMKLHVLASGTAPAASTPTQSPAANPPFNASGSSDTPSANSTTNSGPITVTDANGASFTLPTDSDGSPAKVFVLIRPKTTDAYVGQTIPMRIEFYIRNDVDYQQDSLPIINGSDFLMNDLSLRPQEESVAIGSEGYRRESWVTAIEAPKSGDFPLQMERDTYWIKGVQSVGAPNNPFANFFAPRPILAHDNVPSNKLVIHVHSLPDQGRPANFTGAIGQFKVTADVNPTSVDIGDPVKILFTVVGDGNFPYVQCPTLTPDPNWKTYPPTPKVEYADETHTSGTKTFDLSIIAKKNGTLPLPSASFSYFDPDTKQYVTTPVPLPAITVTGTMPVAAAPPPATDDAASSNAPASNANQYLPNRIAIGATQASLVPVYRKPWFWALQGGLVALVIAGVTVIFLRPATNDEQERAEQARRRRSLHEEDDAMREAVRQGDTRAFFLAARHAVQLHLGAQWGLKPEAITLGEVRKRDPERAAALEPLFTQIDELIYSGGEGDGLDLAQWETRVRENLQQLQPA